MQHYKMCMLFNVSYNNSKCHCINKLYKCLIIQIEITVKRNGVYTLIGQFKYRTWNTGIRAFGITLKHA